MIQKLGVMPVNVRSLDSVQSQKTNAATNPVSNNVVSFQGFSENKSNVAPNQLFSAYRAMNGIKMAQTVSFTGKMANVFKDIRQSMVTCRDEANGKSGEKVGSRVDVTDLISKLADDVVYYDDAIKTTIPIEENLDPKNDIATIIPARTQIKKGYYGDIMFETVTRDPVKMSYIDYKKYGEIPTKRIENPKQKIAITLTPRTAKNPTPEKAYVLETKGKLMAVIEDGKDVLLTNAGEINKKSKIDGRLSVVAEQTGNVFKPFEVEIQPIRERKSAPSIGKGTEIVIGMEDGRFVGELIKSIEDFTKKVKNGQILLDPFVAAEGADKVQLAMLAGGFGSRAEYTNASSSAIFHGKEGGAQSTKGVFQTPTGLTMMETTFLTLHKAGLLDCTKLEIGNNVKLYLNKSGVNKGNGGFTVDLYNKMEREGRDSLFILPNDSMSRMTEATGKAAALMNSGKAAITMIAKEVKSEDARGTFGIMKISDDNEILAFAEKPKVIPEGYEKDGNCLTNTFQFAVSKEAFKALATIEPHLYVGKGKETRDWSKLYVPIIMALTQEPDAEKIQDEIFKLTAEKNKEGELEGKRVPLEVIEEAKDVVAGQKVYAVPTDEPWADCGTLNALYHTTMQIASGDFPLEDFERAHVLDCINTQTGLVASSKAQKERIEAKYDIKDQVMVVEQADPVDTKALLNKYKDAITINGPKKANRLFG